MGYIVLQLIFLLFFACSLFSQETKPPYVSDFRCNSTISIKKSDLDHCSIKEDQQKNKIPNFSSAFIDAVVSSNGKHLYTLERGNFLALWTLNPLRQIYRTFIGDGNFDKVLVSSNELHIVFKQASSSGTFSIWDTKKKKLLNRTSLGIQGNGNVHRADLAIIAENRLLLIDHSSNLELWDLTTLKHLKDSRLPVMIPECTNFDLPLLLMKSRDEKVIVAINEDTINFVDSTTLQDIKQITTEAKTYYTNYDPDALFYQDSRGTFELDINTMQESKLSPTWLDEHNGELNKHQRPRKKTKLTSSGEKVYLTVQQGNIQFTNSQNNQKIATLYRFTDGEWVALSNEGYFDTSAKGIKHINTLISPFDTKKIDDITYQQYHRSISIP